MNTAVLLHAEHPLFWYSSVLGQRLGFFEFFALVAGTSTITIFVNYKLARP